MALKRDLGILEVFAVAAGAMISSGLFVLPTVVFAEVGPGVTLCYLGAALLLVPALAGTAELMTAMPKAGGTYFFIDRSLGPAFGAAGGIATWASIAFKSAFALLGIGLLAADVWNWGIEAWQVKAVATGFGVLFAGVNLLGARHAGRIQIGLVGMLLLILVAYVICSLGRLDMPRPKQYMPRGIGSVLTGIAMVFISFGGVAKVSNLGEEVRQPRRDLIIGMFVAAGVVGVLYVGVVLATVGVLPNDPLQWRPAPISQAAQLMWGKFGAVAMGAAAMAAFLTTGNAGILSASRTLMAMSQDHLLPSNLGEVGEKRGTPKKAIMMTAGFMLAVIWLLDLTLFVKAASAMMILLFILTLVAVVLMRESRIPTYQPSWKAPLYPWLEIAGIVAYGFLLVELGTLPLAVTGAIIGAAVVWYAFYAKVHVLRESALIRLAGRLAETDFEDYDLEAELSRITRERDQVVMDRFDHLVHECEVIDMSRGATREELFRLVAERLARRVGYSAEDLHGMLESRESISTTVVRPGLAIPHLVLEGIESLEVVLVRSKEGVVFAEGERPVTSVFVLAAPPEERNFYLKALVAIAEIAQDPEFDNRWRAARGTEALREVVLAAERRRDHSFGGQ